MTLLTALIVIVQVLNTAPESRTISEVLREPLPSEDLSCATREATIAIQGPTFRYTVDRASGAISDLEVERAGKTVTKLRTPVTLWIEDFSLAKASGGGTRVLSEGRDQIVLLTEGEWPPGVSCSIRSVFYNDGVQVSEVLLKAEADLELRQGIRYEINATGRFTHYLHKRRDTEGMDCFKGALPRAGETVRMSTPTSCLEVFSPEAALAIFTDRGDIYRSPEELDSAAVRVDSIAGEEATVGLHQHIIHAGPNGTPYTLRAGELFQFRVGLAIAPNRLPHPRWRDLRMFIWVGDEKHPYPSDEEIQTVARLGFTLFQMHRLGPPGEPRPPAEELDRVIKTVHDAGMLFLWTANADLQYANAPAVVELLAEGNWRRWQGFNYGGAYKASMDAFCNTLATCLASPNGLADYRIACKERMLERYSVDGMYIDDNLAYANCNLWQEHGHPQEVYDCLIELHDVNWRRRQTLRAHCPHAVLIDHCSHAFVLPLISAFDGHLFGEGYTFPSVEVYRATFGSFSNMYAQGCLFAGDSETTRCAAETAYAFDLLTGGGQYCSLDWRLWPEKFPYAAGVNRFEPLFIKTYNLAQYYFGIYECGPVMELETTAPGTYAALYHNRVWNESLVVAANMSKTATTCSLVTPEAPIRSLENLDTVVVYDVHLRNATVVPGERGGDSFMNMQLGPQQLRLMHLRRTPGDAVYHQWGGKRIAERWDPAARSFSLRIHGPAGLEDWVVLGTGGNTLGQVTVEGRPAEFYVDPERGLAYGEVTFGSEPILLETVAVPAPDGSREAEILPRKPLSPDELTTEYR